MRSSLFSLTSLLGLLSPTPLVAATTTSYHSSEPFDRTSVCSTTTWTDWTDGIYSPSVSDCQLVVNSIDYSKKDGFMVKSTTADDNYVEVLKSGTCIFGLKVFDWSRGEAPVSWGDITDLINDSISKFQVDGFVGTSGEMSCYRYWDHSPGITVGWAIYKNPDFTD
ncbi:hypothetical protein F5Y16DRAFT_397142 [Xylariaceae sp. FL0255]|nr:hypothetical protein F5Y16DRAFT_397142 [Xylariaceae sp. FL0255]